MSRRKEPKHPLKPSDLYGQFAVIPLALLRDPRAKGKHLAVYAAVYSTYDERTGICGGNDKSRNKRLLERSGLSWSAFYSAEKDLQTWGYLERIATPDRTPNKWRLLPMLYNPDEVATEAAEDAEALDPARTGREGGLKPQGSRGGRDSLEADGTTKEDSKTGKGLAVDARDSRVHRAKVSRPARDSVDVLDTEIENSGGIPHRREKHTTKEPETDTERLANLQRAVGTDRADLALEYAKYRAVRGEVNDVWSFARGVGECYAGRCRTEHEGFHGQEAMNYHRDAILADHRQDQRAKDAGWRSPSSETWTKDADADLQRQKTSATESLSASARFYRDTGEHPGNADTDEARTEPEPAPAPLNPPEPKTPPLDALEDLKIDELIADHLPDDLADTG